MRNRLPARLRKLPDPGGDQLDLGSILEPSPLPADAVEVGSIAGASGIRGEFRVHSHSGAPDLFLASTHWHLQVPTALSATFPGGTCRAAVADVREQGGNIVARLQGVDSRNLAEALARSRILVSRSAFPPLEEGEYYWVDLIGLAVHNRQGEPLGRVQELISTGPNQVLVLDTGSQAGAGERLIPFVDAYIDRVDLERGEIVADWGLDY